MLEPSDYSLEEELFIENNCSIELCKLCGDYFAIRSDYCYVGRNNFVELTLDGKFYCQKCK